jgi:excisionase family DNA binding protein
VVEFDPQVQTAAYSRRHMRELLGVSESQIDRATAAGEIPGVFRLGRLVRYRKSIIDKWLAIETTDGEK